MNNRDDEIYSRGVLCVEKRREKVGIDEPESAFLTLLWTPLKDR
jgi:hypothetical protein